MRDVISCLKLRKQKRCILSDHLNCIPGGGNGNDCPDDEDCSTTVFIVLIVIMSILFIASAVGGGYFFWKLKKATLTNKDYESDTTKPFSFADNRPTEIKRDSILKSSSVTQHKDSLKNSLIQLESASSEEDIRARNTLDAGATDVKPVASSSPITNSSSENGNVLKPSLKTPKEIEKDYLEDGDEDIPVVAEIVRAPAESPKKGVAFSGQAEVLIVKGDDDDENVDFDEKL